MTTMPLRWSYLIAKSYSALVKNLNDPIAYLKALIDSLAGCREVLLLYRAHAACFDVVRSKPCCACLTLYMQVMGER